MLFFWMLAAQAGSVFYIDSSAGEVRTFDTRTLGDNYHSGGHACVTFGGHMALALDVSRRRLWFFHHFPSPWNDNLGSRDIDTLRDSPCTPPFINWNSDALSFDPVRDTPVLFETFTGSRMVDASTTFPIQDTGIAYIAAADWYAPAGYHLVLGRDGFFAVDGVTTPTLLAPLPPEVVRPWDGDMAYDSDTRLLWLFENYNIWAIDPTTWSVVAEIPDLGLMDGAAGSIDDVPLQTPELLVSGECPGTVYVTAVDATPGEHVLVGSSTRAGLTTVRGGACAGAQLDLASPRLRVDLVANSAGIAATRLQATAGMCDRLMLQALDVDTCLPTSVGTVPATRVP